MRVKIIKAFHQFDKDSEHEFPTSVANHLISDGWAEQVKPKKKRNVKRKKDGNR